MHVSMSGSANSCRVGSLLVEAEGAHERVSAVWRCFLGTCSSE